MSTLPQLNLFGGLKVKANLTSNMPVKNTPGPIWKAKVITATENANKQKLIDNCHKKEGNMIISKTKPSSIIKNLESRDYARGPTKEIMMLTKNDCQALIISRFGTLECGANYKGKIHDRCM